MGGAVAGNSNASAPARSCCRSRVSDEVECDRDIVSRRAGPSVTACVAHGNGDNSGTHVALIARFARLKVADRT